MELYIERGFIDDFYLDVDFENVSPSQKVLIEIFKNYGDVNKFMDVTIETQKDLEDLKSSNVIISHLCSYSIPHPIDSIKDHFFHYSDCSQTLIFTQEFQNWFEEAADKGALC